MINTTHEETTMHNDEQTDETNGRGTSLAERLAGKLGANANARTVYGDPVIRGGTTVIPVAKVAYGFGGGAGGSDQGRGEGGGGGVSATPVGYIEITSEGTSFRRIFDPLMLAPVIIAGGVAGAMILRGIYRLARRNAAGE
jgi:hypothetical protein